MQMLEYRRQNTGDRMQNVARASAKRRCEAITAPAPIVLTFVSDPILYSVSCILYS
jgi:hypothetical protein